MKPPPFATLVTNLLAALLLLVAALALAGCSTSPNTRRDATMTTMAKNSKNALLPPKFVELTLRDVGLVQAYYVVPWAMSVDGERRCWLNLASSPDTSPGGTVQMRVQLQRDGWHVWLVPGYRYRLTDTPKPDAGLVPVVELHEG